MTTRTPAGETPESPEQASKGTAGLPLQPGRSSKSAHADPGKGQGPSKGSENGGCSLHPISWAAMYNTNTSTNAIGCGMTRDRANHRDPTVTMQNGYHGWFCPISCSQRETDHWWTDPGHYCRTYIRHISPFCVFKCSPFIVFVTILKTALSLG